MTVQCALLKCYTILGYSTETVLLIFVFLQTNITVQRRPSGVNGITSVKTKTSELTAKDLTVKSVLEEARGQGHVLEYRTPSLATAVFSKGQC